MPVSFDAAPIDLQMLIENSSRELLTAIDGACMCCRPYMPPPPPPPPTSIRRSHERPVVSAELEGGKVLVLDPTLSGPLGHVIEMEELQRHGVQKTLHLKPGAAKIEHAKIVYIVRANVPNMHMIAEQVRGLPAGREYEIHVCQVPRRAHFCERVLEEEGVCDDMTFCDLDLGFIPVERDLLSMESPEAFRMTKLIGDKTHLFDIAKSLMQLQVVTGIIAEVKGKGADAKLVAEMMIKLRAELGMHDEQKHCEDAFHSLVLIDRASDMVTPMLTQLTYGGLIDDTWGLRDGVATVPGSLVPGPHQHTADKTKPIKLLLDETDELWMGLRDCPLPACRACIDAAAESLALGPSAAAVAAAPGGGVVGHRCV